LQRYTKATPTSAPSETPACSYARWLGILSQHERDYIAQRNREYETELQRVGANAPGQAEAREREHACGPSSCTMSLRPIFAPRVTNVNVLVLSTRGMRSVRELAANRDLKY
jgi:hypothetical protein